MAQTNILNLIRPVITHDPVPFQSCIQDNFGRIRHVSVSGYQQVAAQNCYEHRSQPKNAPKRQKCQLALFMLFLFLHISTM